MTINPFQPTNKKMINVEKKAKELVADIANEVIKSLYRQGLLNEPKAMLNPKILTMVEALIKKMKPAKYDPCRKLRKGDQVKLRKEIDGRDLTSFKKSLQFDKVYTVETDEKECFVTLQEGDSTVFCSFMHLELVTPVEEIEPYYIERHGEKAGGFCYTVHKRGGYAESTFYFGDCRSRNEAEAKEAAEAECDRLNAEHRKELEK